MSSKINFLYKICCTITSPSSYCHPFPPLLMTTTAFSSVDTRFFFIGVNCHLARVFFNLFVVVFVFYSLVKLSAFVMWLYMCCRGQSSSAAGVCVAQWKSMGHLINRSHSSIRWVIRQTQVMKSSNSWPCYVVHYNYFMLMISIIISCSSNRSSNSVQRGGGLMAVGWRLAGDACSLLRQSAFFGYDTHAYLHTYTRSILLFC